MAVDRAEVIAEITRRLRKEKLSEAQWATVQAAIANRFTPTTKQQLVDLLIAGDIEEVGRLVHTAIQAEVDSIALAEAEALMADDTLVLADLLRIL